MHQSRFAACTLTILVAMTALLGGTVAAIGPITNGPPASTSPTITDARLATDTVAQPAVDRVDFLEITAVDDGEYAYQFRVRGYVQKTRVDDRVKAEANDELRRNPDGTITVTGTTGNGQSDAYVIAGEIVSFTKIRGPSAAELRLNGLELTVDELLNTDTLEIVSRDEDETVRYQFRVRGTVESVRTGDDIAGDIDDRITDNGDGTVTVRGVTDDQDGDAFRITGTVLSFRKTGGDSRYILRLDGLEVNADTLLPGPENGAGDGDDDAGDDDDGNDVTRIRECTRIDEPGRYVLTRNIWNGRGDTCIEVHASDVIIDGNGYRLDGVDASGTIGVEVSPTDDESLSNVTVRDIDVADWGIGVRASSRSGGSLAGVTLVNVESVSNMNFGVYFAEVDGGRVVDATVRANGGTGILLDEPGEESAVLDSVVAGNDGYGIVLFDGAVDALVRGNQVTNNSGNGIATSNGDRDTTIERNLVSSNGAIGISVSDSRRPEITRNVIKRNGRAGISADDASNATITENEVAENARGGITLQYVDGSSVRENEVVQNGGGITLVRSRDNVIVRNVVCGNGGNSQILVDSDSSGNEIRGNRLTC